MRIWSLDEILKTENLGNEKYVRAEEIERLEKENEWLFDELIDLHQRRTTTDMPAEEMKEILVEDMQRALKDRRDKGDKMETTEGTLRQIVAERNTRMGKENEQLTKENEWLIAYLARETTSDAFNIEGYPEEILQEMQQALKEG